MGNRDRLAPNLNCHAKELSFHLLLPPKLLDRGDKGIRFPCGGIFEIQWAVSLAWDAVKAVFMVNWVLIDSCVGARNFRCYELAHVPGAAVIHVRCCAFLRFTNDVVDGAELRMLGNDDASGARSLHALEIPYGVVILDDGPEDMTPASSYALSGQVVVDFPVLSDSFKVRPV